MRALDNKSKRKVIAHCRQQVQLLKKLQDKLFNKACREVGLKPHMNDEINALFCHIFNEMDQPTSSLVRYLWPVQDARKGSRTKQASTTS